MRADRPVGLAFGPLVRPVRVSGPQAGVARFVAALRQTVPDWPVDEVAPQNPLCTVTARRQTYDVVSDYLDAPFRRLPVAAAVCSVLADLSEAYVDAHPGTRALHCGAVQIAGQMILLTGRGRAGKSTLIARLSMEPGVRVFCDDVLPIHPDGRAIALGVPPRVRLPLPPAAAPAFVAHVAGSGGCSDGRYAFVPGPSIAPHGTDGRPRVLLRLRRTPDAHARLHPMTPAEAVSLMLAQDMSLQQDGAAHIDRVSAMAGAMLCATLVYADLEDAVRLLHDLAGRLALGQDPDFAAGPPPEDDPRPAIPPADTARLWRREDGVAVRHAQGAAYLWDPTSGRYFHLNTVALACWHLLETPMTGATLAREVGWLFEVPDTGADRAAVEADIGRLLGQLHDGGLVTPG
jgi:hypothetical protein